ncbi:diguanylate cyclase [Shewanella zhangzhouensis]|uniref:diguanylate cyclase n=1 Tax=Shewanella zhangzhouensis TaxID=2864213 RepID=UPI001C6578F2|nr:7TM diverse intracellular signaling domain-containing protein [Shewanella zhangzhouensis]QYK06349.1 diguanylate cyclase [Shewanella zhangzhouensis]
MARILAAILGITLFLPLFWSVKANAAVALDAPYQFVAADDDVLPTAFEAVPDWLDKHKDIKRLPLSGGQFYLAVPFMVNENRSDWVVNLHNSIAEKVDYLVLGRDGSRQLSSSGYYAPYQYLFDYGRNVTLRYGVEYWLLVRVESRYFSSFPKLEINPVPEHRQLTDRLAVAVLLCLGGLLFIAFYNLLIYGSTRDKAFLYYGLYVIVYLLGWAFTFHVPAHLLSIHGIGVHHVFFIGLPIFNILFYKHFLQLPSYSPRLWRLSQYLLWACILALPTSWLLISYTAIIASVLIGAWIVLAIVAGNVCLMKGFSPARYFIMAFSCLLLPAMLILPGNMGLTSDIIEYAEFATLAGGTADALLLSLALANKLKLLSEERKAYIEELSSAWEKARVDSLTQIGNRYAFDEYLQTCNTFGVAVTKPTALVLLDVDGIKKVNDTLGHQVGDELLRVLVQELKSLDIPKLKLFRVGGDEFALFLDGAFLSLVTDKLENIETIFARQGFTDAGVSFGYALDSEVQKSHEWLRAADTSMYTFKAEKRRELAVDAMEA